MATARSTKRVRSFSKAIGGFLAWSNIIRLMCVCRASMDANTPVRRLWWESREEENGEFASGIFQGVKLKIDFRDSWFVGINIMILGRYERGKGYSNYHHSVHKMGTQASLRDLSTSDGRPPRPYWKISPKVLGSSDAGGVGTILEFGVSPPCFIVYVCTLPTSS